MVQKKPDRRTERTPHVLMMTFIDLVLSEGYDTVTIERVVERANIGRSTFYMHYTGKEDILKQSMARPSSVLAVMSGSAKTTAKRFFRRIRGLGRCAELNLKIFACASPQPGAADGISPSPCIPLPHWGGEGVVLAKGAVMKPAAVEVMTA